MEEWAFGFVLAMAGLALWGSMFWIWREGVEGKVLGLYRPRVSWREFKRLGRLADGVPGPWDYHTNGWGDVFALPLIDFAVGAAVYKQGVDWQAVLVAGLMGFLASYAFFRMATKPRRAKQDIDWWFRFKPTDKSVYVTLAGRIHLAYFALQTGIAVLGIGYLVTSRMPFPTMIVGAIGAFLYVSAFVADKAEGHFD